MANKKIQVEFRILREAVCYDGELVNRWHPQVRIAVGSWTNILGEHCSGYVVASVAIAQSEQRLPAASWTVVHRPAVTTKHHSHIGDYGSAERFPCETLDGVEATRFCEQGDCGNSITKDQVAAAGPAPWWPGTCLECAEKR